MNDDLERSQNTHIYKPKRWMHALNIFTALFMAIVMGIPLVGIILLIRTIPGSQSEPDAFMAVFGCILAPLALLLGLNIIQSTINAILAFFSYVKISPDGIEHKLPIYKHIRCHWADVDRLGKLFLFTDVVYLNSYEVIGPSLSLKSSFSLLRPRQGFITLRGYDGWPEGQLANDLKQYAPHLFEREPVVEGTQQEYKEPQKVDVPASGTSQDNHLLAALSHASVMFSSMGAIVPLVIYATQGRKSSYLSFQALQALIWQIIAFVFTILTSSCMAGAILITALSATSSQNVENFSGVIFITILGSVLLMTFGNLAFVIYGLIGAIKTYRGKDFRYAIIGNRIQGSKDVSPANR